MPFTEVALPRAPDASADFALDAVARFGGVARPEVGDVEAAIEGVEDDVAGHPELVGDPGDGRDEFPQSFVGLIGILVRALVRVEAAVVSGCMRAGVTPVYPIDAPTAVEAEEPP